MRKERIDLDRLFPPHTRPTLRNLSTRHPDRPLAGRRVLHAVPLFKNTLTLVEAAAHLGARLVVTSFPGAPYDPSCVDWLQDRGIEFSDPGKVQGAFDYILDCGGAYRHLSNERTRAIVELTRSGAIEYGGWVRPGRPPVISVDGSAIKILEDLFGLADGFVRGLSKQLGALPSAGVLVIGAGKVGQGVASGALGFSDRVGLVDLDPKSLRIPEALRARVQVYSRQELLDHPERFDGYGTVVTATAVAQVMTRDYPPGFFRGRTLANMGVGDEWGDSYRPEDVLCKKGILNFALEEPTRLLFLDPSFSAMLATLVAIEGGQWVPQPGFQNLPAEIERRILSEWMGTRPFTEPWQETLARELGLLK